VRRRAASTTLACATLAAWVTGFQLATASWAQSPTPNPLPDGPELVTQIVSVTGKVRLTSLPAGLGTAIEIEAGDDRYRIAEVGLGLQLMQHVGRDVTVVAYVEPSAQDGRPLEDGRLLLLVQRFTVHGI
jgi:hypothetical protein